MSDEKRFVAVIEDGMWVGPNACPVCRKWFPPYKCAVPTDTADEFCWGHQPLEHLVDLEGECWGASQIGHCTFSATHPLDLPRGELTDDEWHSYAEACGFAPYPPTPTEEPT